MSLGSRGEDEARETGTLGSLSKLGGGEPGTAGGDSSHLGFLDGRAACLAGWSRALLRDNPPGHPSQLCHQFLCGLGQAALRVVPAWGADLGHDCTPCGQQPSCWRNGTREGGCSQAPSRMGKRKGPAKGRRGPRGGHQGELGPLPSSDQVAAVHQPEAPSRSRAGAGSFVSGTPGISGSLFSGGPGMPFLQR